MAVPKFSELLAATSTALKRDAQVLSPLAGLFIFVPLAVLLWLILSASVQPNGEPSSPADVQKFVEQHGLWLVPPMLVAAWGQLAIICFLVDPDRPTAGGAILRALKIFLPYLAVMFLIQLALQLVALALGVLGLAGQFLFFALAIYVSMRVFLVAPALAERGRGMIAAVTKSWTLTAGGFWKPYLLFIVGVIAAAMLGMIGMSLVALPVGAFFGRESEFGATAILLALVLAALSLYSQLFSVSAYRMLGRD